ncbi:hypothetical protein MPSI1_003424 [Malassezia psittaci]|uniref:PCI domain-containing protein n=1 Tax=Malassezia psittaci TaxID=1821823 RepID=A0AAF0FHR4_9BASI|nr:hypothetical protein MPSI1_003424 [Malassezia psittaci]
MVVEDALGAYLEQLQNAIQACNGDEMKACVSLDTKQHAVMQSAVLSVNLDPVLKSMEFRTSSTSHERRFKSFTMDFLNYVGQHQAQDYSNSAYDAFVKVFSDATALFSLPDTVWFIPCLKQLAKMLVTLAIQSDKKSESRTYTKTIDAAGRLSKCAGLAANDRTNSPGQETKRAAVLALANQSFRSYFRLNNTRLCETVLGSVQNALLMNRKYAAASDSQETGEEVYCMSERVTYRYYLGRIRLIQHRIQLAAQHLNWAFEHCPSGAYVNQRKILISLIPVQLILGKYATQSLLQTYDLLPFFARLVEFQRVGYGYGVQLELEKHCDWLRTRGLYMILREKTILGLWRNLFRQCLRWLPPPTSANAPPTLPLAQLVRPARLAWNDEKLELSDIECAAANLVDQGLIKAYILHSKGLVVLQKGPHLGFPPLATIYEK